MSKYVEELSQTIFKNGILNAAITIVLILAGAVVIDFIIRRGNKRAVLRRPDDVTQLQFIRKMLRIAVIVLAAYGILTQFKSFDTVANSVLAGSGVAVLILGLAAQEAMGNFISGFFLSMSKPFKIGDRITLLDRDLTGFVEDITLRHTVIRTFQNTRVIVPNSIMNQTVIDNAQYREEKVCTIMGFSVSCDSDLDRAMAIIAETVENHPAFIDNRSEEERRAGEPKVAIRLTELTDWAATLRCGVWAENAGAAYVMGSDIRLVIKKRFAEEGIKMPSAHHNIIIQK